MFQPPAFLNIEKSQTDLQQVNNSPRQSSKKPPPSRNITKIREEHQADNLKILISKFRTIAAIGFIEMDI